LVRPGAVGESASGSSTSTASGEDSMAGRAPDMVGDEVVGDWALDGVGCVRELTLSQWYACCDKRTGTDNHVLVCSVVRCGGMQ
jgi:hypothetical protein